MHAPLYYVFVVVVIATVATTSANPYTDADDEAHNNNNNNNGGLYKRLLGHVPQKSDDARRGEEGESAAVEQHQQQPEVGQAYYPPPGANQPAFGAYNPYPYVQPPPHLYRDPVPAYGALPYRNQQQYAPEAAYLPPPVQRPYMPADQQQQRFRPAYPDQLNPMYGSQQGGDAEQPSPGGFMQNDYIYPQQGASDSGIYTAAAHAPQDIVREMPLNGEAASETADKPGDDDKLLADQPCDRNNCPPLENCLNVTQTDCCPACAQWGCPCQGYQTYDCIANGYESLKVPEGQSYTVDEGSTLCKCPLGGGQILCSFVDEESYQMQMPLTIKCTPIPLGCYERRMGFGGCEECLQMGCYGEGDLKYKAGERFKRDDCWECFCPEQGGELMCRPTLACESGRAAGESPGQGYESVQHIIPNLADPSQQMLYGGGGQGFVNPAGTGANGGAEGDEQQPIGYDTRLWGDQPVLIRNSEGGPPTLLGGGQVADESAGSDAGPDQDKQGQGFIPPAAYNPYNSYGMHYGQFQPYPAYNNQPIMESDKPAAGGGGAVMENPALSGYYAANGGGGGNYGMRNYLGGGELPSASDYQDGVKEVDDSYFPSDDNAAAADDGGSRSLPDSPVANPNNVAGGGGDAKKTDPLADTVPLGYGGGYQDPYNGYNLYGGAGGYYPLAGAGGGARPNTGYLGAQEPSYQEQAAGMGGGYDPNSYYGFGAAPSSSQEGAQEGKDGSQQQQQSDAGVSVIRDEEPINQQQQQQQIPYNLNPYSNNNGADAVEQASMAGDGGRVPQMQQQQRYPVGGYEYLYNSHAAYDPYYFANQQQANMRLNGGSSNAGPYDQPTGGNMAALEDGRQGRIVPQGHQRDEYRGPLRSDDVRNNFASSLLHANRESVTEQAEAESTTTTTTEQPTTAATTTTSQPDLVERVRRPGGGRRHHHKKQRKERVQPTTTTTTTTTTTQSTTTTTTRPTTTTTTTPKPTTTTTTTTTTTPPPTTTTTTTTTPRTTTTEPPTTTRQYIAVRETTPPPPQRQDDRAWQDARPENNAWMPADSSRYPDAPTDNQLPMSDDSHARETTYDGQKNPRYPTYGNDYSSPYQAEGDEYASPSYDDQGYPHYDGSVDDQMQFLQNLYSNLYKNHNDTHLPPVYNSNSTSPGGEAADYPDPYSPDKSYILENSSSSSSRPRWTRPEEEQERGLQHAPRTLEIDESYENVLSWCCTQGRNWGVGHDTCDGIPPKVGTYQQTCAMAQRKCCEKSLDERGCELGISSARNMTACDSIAPTFGYGQCQANNVKTCCDCCALGLKSHGMGLSCDMEILGHPCSGAYSKCCREGAMTASSSSSSSQHTSKTTSEPNSDSSNSNGAGAVTILPYGAELGCRGSGGGGCDHECEDVIGGGFRCTCRSGYALADDEKSCQDVNECALGSHTCGPSELCFNSLGSFTCQRRLSCGTGYVLTNDNTCDDIDECALKKDNCRGSTECVNIRGSFRCVPRQCGSGFVTDAAGNCIDINECFSGDFQCPATAACKNTPGSYVCLCHGGYELSADKSICQDINECAAATSPCDDTATCVNTDGSYQCVTIPTLTCMPGYTPNEEETECVDVDECAEGMDDCAAGATCINLDGSFECSQPIVCKSGERHNYDRTACEDIDECLEHLDSCGHGGRCVNTPGSYLCMCEQGYVKRSGLDGRMRCEDVDECSTQETNCQYRCVNTPGQYFCECPAGYTIKNERTCVDIDECQLGTAACHPDETCFNTKGSYKCVNITCPDNYTKLPKRRCSRVSCGGDKRKRSLREMRACSKLPKQIVFHNISLANGTDVHRPLFRMYVAKSSPTDRHTFHITSGNEDDMFSVAKTKKDGRVAGVVYSKRELVGPRDYTLDLTLRLSRRRRYISLVARLFIYVSDHVF